MFLVGARNPPDVDPPIETRYYSTPIKFREYVLWHPLQKKLGKKEIAETPPS